MSEAIEVINLSKKYKITMKDGRFCFPLYKILSVTCIAWMILVLPACSTQQNAPAPIAQTAEERQPVQAFGVVRAQNIQDISIGSPVKVESLLVQEGQVVVRGETLAMISMDDADDVVRELEEQLALLRLETSQKQKMLAGKKESVSKNTDPDRIKLENALNWAKAEYDSLLTGKDGKQSLLEAGALSEQEYLDYLKKADAAEYAMEDAELTLKSFMGFRHEEILQTEADINENQLKISEWSKKLQRIIKSRSSEYLKGNAVISAFSKGIIFSVNCKSGETVPVGERLFSVMDASSMVIDARVDEQFIKDVKLGARAYVIPESDTDQEYRGKVTAISAFAVQQNSETVIPVQISLDKQSDGIYPGYNMEITIEVQ